VPGISDSLGFSVFELMKPLGGHDDIEPTVANVLEVGEAAMFVVSNEPPILTDIILGQNVMIDFVGLLSVWDNSGHIPPVTMP
jgi:hypothetical protein